MGRRIIALALLLGLLAGLAAPPPGLAQDGPPALVAQSRLPGSGQIKLPAVAVTGSTVVVAGNIGQRDAVFWEKADAAGSFNSLTRIGSALGQPDYATASAFAAADGTLYFAWGSIDEKRIYMRSRAPSGGLGPVRTVISSSPFAIEATVAANEDGVFVFWREPERPIFYRRSADGAAWGGPTRQLTSGPALPTMSVDAAPGRRLILGYTRSVGSRVQPFAAIWDGGGFLHERISVDDQTSFANPSVAIGPDGTYAAAYRNEASDLNISGVYVSERSAEGRWSPQQARVGRGATSSAALTIDVLGNWHLFWVSRLAGAPDLYYAYREAGRAFGGSPTVVDLGGQPMFNLDAASNLRGRSYGHAVGERFSGGESYAQYFGFSGPARVVSAAGIAIAGGAARSAAGSLPVSFSGLSGEPTAVRWRWGAPPSGAASDSGGFVPFTNPLAVPAPADTAAGACGERLLFTQLRGETTTQLGTNQDSILIDRAVQATVELRGQGPSPDPGYTSSPQVGLSVDSAAECAGLASGSVSGPIVGGGRGLAVAGSPRLSAELELSGPAGPKDLTVSLADELGNEATLVRRIVYDPTPPLLTDQGEPLPLRPDPRGSVLVELEIAGAQVGDEGGLYGLQLTNVVAPASGRPASRGQAALVPFDLMDEAVLSGGGVSLRLTWSLAVGLPLAALEPGSYTVEVRFVDRAGNLSGPFSRQITLDAVTLVATRLPLARR